MRHVDCAVGTRIEVDGATERGTIIGREAVLIRVLWDSGCRSWCLPSDLRPAVSP